MHVSLVHKISPLLSPSVGQRAWHYSLTPVLREYSLLPLQCHGTAPSVDMPVQTRPCW